MLYLHIYLNLYLYIIIYIKFIFTNIYIYTFTCHLRTYLPIYIHFLVRKFIHDFLLPSISSPRFKTRRIDFTKAVMWVTWRLVETNNNRSSWGMFGIFYLHERLQYLYLPFWGMKSELIVLSHILFCIFTYMNDEFLWYSCIGKQYTIVTWTLTL